MVDLLMEAACDLILSALQRVTAFKNNDKEAGMMAATDLMNFLLSLALNLPQDTQSKYESENMNAKVFKLPDDRRNFSAVLELLDQSGVTINARQGQSKNQVFKPCHEHAVAV